MVLYSGRLFLPYPQTLDNNERLGRDKHSSLLRTFSNYNSKKFLTLGPGVDHIKHIWHKFTYSFIVYLHVRFQGAISH